MPSDYDETVNLGLPARLRAVYLGNGCFRRQDGALAFVRRINRPDWLHEGTAYIIGWTPVQWGLQYHVIEIAPRPGVYAGGR